MAKSSPHHKNGKTRSTAASSRKKVRAAGLAVTKAERITALLRRAGGASLDEMMKATGWQQHSLRGFMSGTLVKRKGLTIASEKAGDERRYRIVESGAAT